MSVRTANTALAARNAVWGALSRTAGLQRRRFSTSPSHQVHVVSFSETSSPGLDEVLTKIREKIILPSYLRHEQRKKIYDYRYQKKLEFDPVTMEIDGEVLKFYYTNILKELPNTREVVFQAINQMKTPEDWENLPRLLEGVCVHAGRKLRHYDYPKIIRKAALHDQLNAILVCLRQVKRTGFKLASSEVTNELLVWIQKRAVESGWDEAATRDALAWTDRVVVMLEDEKHQPKRKRGEVDLKAYPLFRDPQVLASRLHMAAAVAVKHQGGEDADGQVAKYARELLSLWPEGKGLKQLHPAEAYEERTEMWYLRDANEFLWHASPILSGFRMAAQVVEPALAQQLGERSAPLEEEVAAALADPHRKKGGRGEDMHAKLFGAGEA